MRFTRRKRIAIFLCLALAIIIGILLICWRQPAEFVDGFTVTFPNADTIQVIGTRIPGGEGIWRYHIRADRWEEVPSRVVNIPHLDSYHQKIPRERFPLDDGSVTLCQATDEPPAYKWAIPTHETKRFIQVQLRDGTMTELGVIAHTPKMADWGMLPDRSGIWVREERDTPHKDAYQMVVHSYSFLTQQWKIVYQSTWNGTARREPDRGSIYDHTNSGYYLLRRHGDWVLVFHNADYYLPSSPKPVLAEIWVNLCSGAARLGEPSTDPCLTDFSPDGQYCFMEDSIRRAPDWPQGAGVVGQTYSLACNIGSMPKFYCFDWAIGAAPAWTSDSRHVLYTAGIILSACCRTGWKNY